MFDSLGLDIKCTIMCLHHRFVFWKHSTVTLQTPTLCWQRFFGIGYWLCVKRIQKDSSVFLFKWRGFVRGDKTYLLLLTEIASNNNNNNNEKIYKNILISYCCLVLNESPSHLSSLQLLGIGWEPNKAVFHTTSSSSLFLPLQAATPKYFGPESRLTTLKHCPRDFRWTVLLLVDCFVAIPFLRAIILSVFECLLSIYAMLLSTAPTLAAFLNCGIAASTAEAVVPCQLLVPSQTLRALQPLSPTQWSSCWQIWIHLCSLLPHLALFVDFMLVNTSSNTDTVRLSCDHTVSALASRDCPKKNNLNVKATGLFVKF